MDFVIIFFIMLASVMALIAVGKVIEIPFPQHQLGIVTHLLQSSIIEDENYIWVSNGFYSVRHIYHCSTRKLLIYPLLQLQLGPSIKSWSALIHQKDSSSTGKGSSTGCSLFFSTWNIGAFWSNLSCSELVHSVRKRVCTAQPEGTRPFADCFNTLLRYLNRRWFT